MAKQGRARICTTINKKKTVRERGLQVQLRGGETKTREEFHCLRFVRSQFIKKGNVDYCPIENCFQQKTWQHVCMPTTGTWKSARGRVYELGTLLMLEFRTVRTVNRFMHKRVYGCHGVKLDQFFHKHFIICNPIIINTQQIMRHTVLTLLLSLEY